MTSDDARVRLQRGDVLYGAWTQTRDLAAMDAIASASYDYVVIDLQHGSASEVDLPGLCAVIANRGPTPLVRNRSGHFADIGRTIDLGARGVIVPNVGGHDEAAQVVQSCHYPPAGQRSIGRLLGDVTAPLCIVMVESASALEDLPRTVSLAGIDAVYVGPSDLSLSLGCPYDLSDPTLSSALLGVIETCRSAGVPVGVHATSWQQAELPKSWGCQLLTVFSDLGSLGAEAARSVESARAKA